MTSHDWTQRAIHLRPRPRGFHLVTEEVCRQLPELSSFTIGLCHLFLQHTSASLTINENADPDVRHDLEASLNRVVPEDRTLYRHTAEGPDDMTSHAKCSLFGCFLTIPIAEGRLALGVWQGIVLGEHRHHAGSRSIVATSTGLRTSAT